MTILVITKYAKSLPSDVSGKLESDLGDTAKKSKGSQRLAESTYQIDLETGLPFLAWLLQHPSLRCSVAMVNDAVVWHQCEPLNPTPTA